MLSFIVESGFRSLCLGIVVWIALRVFRVRDPQTQSLAWRAVLFSALAMPLLMPILEGLLRTTPSVALYWIPAAQPSILQPLAAAIPAKTPSSFAWPAILPVGYVAVAAALMLRLIIGLEKSRRLCGGARPLMETWTSGRDVRVSAGIRMPATFGATILLPADWDRWSAFEQESVFLHESCHVRRGDFYVHLLAGLHRAIFWFNPLAWWLQNRLVELAESICDDAALRKVEDRVSYAEVLVKFAASASETRFVGLAMARGRTVGRRVERVLRETVVAPAASLFRRLLILSLFVPVAGFSAGTWLLEPEVAAPLAIRFQVTQQPPVGAVQQVPAQQRAPQSSPAGVSTAVAPVKQGTQYLAAWPQQEVPYIIHPAEQAAFNLLKTDEEREQFIEAFWLLRDPTPGSFDNEFRDEYYRRIVLANDRYSSRTGLPGWRSDRGRVLIQLGEPDELERHPGSLATAGDGTLKETFPSEAWRYKFVQGIGQNATFVFVDSTGEGIYRLQSNPGVQDVPQPGRER